MGKQSKKKLSPLETVPKSGPEATDEQAAKVIALHKEAKKKQDEAFKADGMEIRTYVLHVALSMEHHISMLLAELLSIDLKTSHVIGYRASPISFNQKVWFLIDIKAIKGEDYKDFQRFMEIRNMLMHNLEARSLEDCFRMISEKDGNDSAVNRVLALADDQIPRMFKPTNPWTVENRLSLGIRIFVDHVAAKAGTAVDALGAQTLERVELLAARDLRDIFKKEINQPALRVAGKVNRSLQLTHNRNEVRLLIKQVADDTRTLYDKCFKETMIAQLNVIRAKAGMDAIDDLPVPPEPSKPSKPQV